MEMNRDKEELAREAVDMKVTGATVGQESYRYGGNKAKTCRKTQEITEKGDK